MYSVLQPLTFVLQCRYTDVRAKLMDPATQHWFLKFDPSKNGTYKVPRCDTNFHPPRCSDLYHDQVRMPMRVRVYEC